MAFILTAAATMRTIEAREGDPLSEWLREEHIRPMIATVTLAQVLNGILGDTRLNGPQRSAYQRLLNEIMGDIEGGTERIALGAFFDFPSARILADILGIEAGSDRLGELDLVPAAIAIQRNSELVVAADLEAWRAFANAINPVTGRLLLREFEPA